MNNLSYHASPHWQSKRHWIDLPTKFVLNGPTTSIGKIKIAGILIENDLQGNKIKNTIIGIGLNLIRKFSARVAQPRFTKTNYRGILR